MGSLGLPTAPGPCSPRVPCGVACRADRSPTKTTPLHRVSISPSPSNCTARTSEASSRHGKGIYWTSFLTFFLTTLALVLHLYHCPQHSLKATSNDAASCPQLEAAAYAPRLTTPFSSTPALRWNTQQKSLPVQHAPTLASKYVSLIRRPCLPEILCVSLSCEDHLRSPRRLQPTKHPRLTGILFNSGTQSMFVTSP